MSKYLVRITLLLGLIGGFGFLAVACGPKSGNGGGDNLNNGGNNCGLGEIECNGVCVDPSSDMSNCGECGIQCNAGMGESCIYGECKPPSECSPGDTISCYSGPEGTDENPPCQAGTRMCDNDGRWGACVNQITPAAEEICNNGIDDNCNGMTDEGCSCDDGLSSNSSDPVDYAKAIGLCQTTTEDGEGWGVISATFSLADGSGTPNSNARSIRPSFGYTSVQEGDSMVVLSTGHAAAQGDTNPSFAPFQGGQDLGLTSGMPADWLTANGGTLPNAPGCPDPEGGTTAFDPIMLTFRIRVPKDANSFTLYTNFFSSEYPEWVCSPYNDFFVVLLDSSYNDDPPNPADKNLAVYTAPDESVYPVGVNLAHGNTGLFRQCLNGPTGCNEGSVDGNVTTCTGVDEIGGTGFDITNPDPQFPGDDGWCGSSNLAGGGTGWLITSGNVVPEEVIELRIAVWDTGDPWYDSVVLIDRFEWNIEASDPGTIIVD